MAGRCPSESVPGRWAAHGVIFASFGRVGEAEWQRLVDERTGSRWFEWRDDALNVRLAVDGPEHAAEPPAVDAPVVAVCAGQLESSTPEALQAAVIDAYLRGGIRQLRSLQGDYVFVLFDRRARALLAGCDSVGLRALAYQWSGDSFVTSSRATSILRRRMILPRWDDAYVAHALAGFWSRSPSATAFRRIGRMTGGEFIRVTVEGLERLVGASLRFDEWPTSESRVITRELRSRLHRAVDERLERASNCIALSGGVDSCAVASALACGRSELQAFTLYSGKEPARLIVAPEHLAGMFPSIRHHLVAIPEQASRLSPITDDPIGLAPMFQAGRTALWTAVREMGLRQVFDGEGGDEIFDIAWRSNDLVREWAVPQLVASMRSPSLRRRLAKNLLVSGIVRCSPNLFRRVWRKRARMRRPWLRPAFWQSLAFRTAWREVLTYERQSRARDRIPDILGIHGRYWRAQEIGRRSLGLEGISPLLDRRIVEFVGSLSARSALDPPHSKVLLRRLVDVELGPSTAWRPKYEPLHDWLVDQALGDDSTLAQAIEGIQKSAVLSEFVDFQSVRDAVFALRLAPRRVPTAASAVVQLFALIDWIVAIEDNYGVQ